MHLLECHNLATIACRENALVISRLTPLPIPLSLHDKWKHLRNYVENFDYLAGEIEKHASKITELKQNVVEQIELFDKRRNRVVGVFVAIYVPLAFTTVCILSVQDERISADIPSRSLG